jgi:hypothetical protein
MKPHSTQFGMRENTASSGPHDSRLVIDMGSSSKRTKERDPKTPISAFENGTSTADLPNPYNAALQCAATGEVTLRDQVTSEPEFLTVSEVALRLRVSRNWVYNHAPSLGVYHLGKYLRFSWPKVLERLGGKS